MTTPASVRAVPVPPASVSVLLPKVPLIVPHTSVPDAPRMSTVPVPSSSVDAPVFGPGDMLIERITYVPLARLAAPTGRLTPLLAFGIAQENVPLAVAPPMAPSLSKVPSVIVFFETKRSDDGATNAVAARPPRRAAETLPSAATLYRAVNVWRYWGSDAGFVNAAQS